MWIHLSLDSLNENLSKSVMPSIALRLFFLDKEMLSAEGRLMALKYAEKVIREHKELSRAAEDLERKLA